MEKKQGFEEFIQHLNIAFEDPADFDPQAYLQLPVELILDYIRRTHRLYLFRKLPEIEQSIRLLLQDYSDDHPLWSILLGFYTDYRSELSHHICDEEQLLLPYIDFIIAAEKKPANLYLTWKNTRNYSLRHFLEGHDDDHEKEIGSLREVIGRYDPPKTNGTPYRILLHQLRNFEKDLIVHGLVEEQVLLPSMLQTEKKVLQEFMERVKRN
jgi:regulator of cell morphogenesis and NO signaling